MRKGFFRRKTDTLLGVDINDTAISLVELSHSTGGYTIQGYATQALPAHAVVDGTLLDLEGIGRVLQAALARLRTSARGAAVAVSGPSVITRVIEMEAGLSDDEMTWMIQMEADQYIPYPLDDVSIDFQVRGQLSQDPTRVQVLLAACLKAQVERARRFWRWPGWCRRWWTSKRLHWRALAVRISPASRRAIESMVHNGPWMPKGWELLAGWP